ncbi:MAG: hypothetical protein OXI66_08230, partial [Boseongicola sp.]|nr:hypothetical protein [Boseongicola sp.]
MRKSLVSDPSLKHPCRAMRGIDGPAVLSEEPVSALGVSVLAQILPPFLDLQQELGLTCLFVAHDLNADSNISDRVAVMHAGRIIEGAENGQSCLAPRHPLSSDLLDAALIPALRAQEVSR